MNATNLDEYLSMYGALLGKQAEDVLEPLHVPGRDELPNFVGYSRQPFPAQGHLIAGVTKALRRQRSILICAEMGTGKTLMGAVAVNVHAAEAQGYRAVVMCPGQLVNKWKREIERTIPHARVRILESCHQLNTMRAIEHERRVELGADWRGPEQPEWLVIGRDRAKLGAEWRPVLLRFEQSQGGKCWKPGYICPGCHQQLVDRDANLVDRDWLEKQQRTCTHPVVEYKREVQAGRVFARLVTRVCGTPLWQSIGPQQGGLNRFEPARYIHKRMKGYFNYFILDEAHEEKSATSAQGEAAGALIAACGRTIALTGTLIGGQANHVRALLFRLAPQTLLAEGIGWKNPGLFDKRYGRIERTVSEVIEPGTTGKHSRGKSRSATERVRPGVMPTLFGRHLLGMTVYLGLEELSDRLPKLREIVLPLTMDPELAQEYSRISKALVDANKQLLVKGSRALLAAMLQCLLAYPDYPFAWDKVGYYEVVKGKRVFVPVVQPKDLGEINRRVKEKKLLEIVKAELRQGRQSWVFVQYTDKHDVLTRLVSVLNSAGVKAIALRSNVSPEKREAWIAKYAPKYDVIVSHPMLVQTGLDLFDMQAGYNFPTLIWYETGYNTFTLRQASRRSWRIGQQRECRVYYLYYEQAAQEAAMVLMGKKLASAQAIEGKFTSEGLVALGGDDVSVEMALAQSLDKLLPNETARVWGTIASMDLPEPEPLPVPKGRKVKPAAAAVELDDDGMLADLAELERLINEDFNLDLEELEALNLDLENLPL